MIHLSTPLFFLFSQRILVLLSQQIKTGKLEKFLTSSRHFDLPSHTAVFFPASSLQPSLGCVFFFCSAFIPAHSFRCLIFTHTSLHPSLILPFCLHIFSAMLSSLKCRNIKNRIFSVFRTHFSSSSQSCVSCLPAYSPSFCRRRVSAQTCVRSRIRKHKSAMTLNTTHFSFLVVINRKKHIFLRVEIAPLSCRVLEKRHEMCDIELRIVDTTHSHFPFAAPRVMNGFFLRCCCCSAVCQRFEGARRSD